MTQRDIFRMFACEDCLENGVSSECECWLSRSWSKVCPQCKTVTYCENHFEYTSCDNCGEFLHLYDKPSESGDMWDRQELGDI